MQRAILTYSATPDVLICRRTALGIHVEIPCNTAAWRRCRLRETLAFSLLIGGAFGVVGALLQHFQSTVSAALVIILVSAFHDWKRWRRQDKRGPSLLLYEAGVLYVRNLRYGPDSDWPAADAPRLRVARVPFSDLPPIVCIKGPWFTSMTAPTQRAEVMDAVAELNAAIDTDRQ